jgi:hypothetical protein
MIHPGPAYAMPAIWAKPEMPSLRCDVLALAGSNAIVDFTTR